MAFATSCFLLFLLIGAGSCSIKNSHKKYKCLYNKEKISRTSDDSNIRTLDLFGISSSLKLGLLLLFPLLFIFIPLLLTLSALLLLPIPILTSPVTGIAAAIGRRQGEETNEFERILKGVYYEPECILRVGCEVGRGLDEDNIRRILDQSLNDMAPYLKDKWEGVINGYVYGSNGRNGLVNNCGKYSCNLELSESRKEVEGWDF